MDFSPATALLASMEKETPIFFKSDHLEYRQGEEVILASGNVRVDQTSYTFLSDFAAIDLQRKKLNAWGTVRFKDVTKNEIRSKFLSYNAADGSAELRDAEGSFGPWLFATQKVERDALGNFVLRKSRLSTCETDLSKYHLYGYRIKILPQKRLTVQHAVFRIGPVPVLYLPYYYYSLGEKHLAFQIFPGQNRSEGAFVRTIWGYPPTDEIFLRLYLDELTKRGLGTGGEMNYYSDQMKGSLYGYTIEDRLTDKFRWNARLFHWQRIQNDWTLQMNANQISDDSFPNDFFREDFNRVVQDFRSALSLTYQKRSLLLRVSGERAERFDPLDQKFFVSEMTAPKIELGQNQTPLGFLGLEKTVSLSVSNRFAGQTSSGTLLNRSNRGESDAQFALIRKFSLNRNLRLIPKLLVRNEWREKPQAEELKEETIQRLGTETTLRTSLGNDLDVDFTYLLTQRLQGNTGDQQGREEHDLSFFSWYRPAQEFSFRFDTRFLLPRSRGEKVDFLNRKNYKPLRGEISFFPWRELEFFFREEYLLSDPLTESAHALSSQGEIAWGDRAQGGDYFSLGSSYFSSRDHVLELRPTARISPFRNWRLEGSLRSLLTYRNGNLFLLSKGELVEKEILVRTEWRCWDFAFTFRERKGVLEFLFNLELQLDRMNRQKSERKSQESEFYPWRRWKN
ncbi:MAG: LPS-assembly protein LptD [Elusimicrobia bacterium]|nr:LPS-assembly protein LptD [Elusimicrobiota bacterium]